MEDQLFHIRPAEPTRTDGEAFAQFVNMASEGGFQKALGGDYVDVMSTAFSLTDHNLSHERTVFVEAGGEIVGMATAYSGNESRRPSDHALRMAPGNRLRRTLGMALLGAFSRILAEVPNEEYYIEFLAVDERARGRGIGSALIGFVEARARELGILRLSLDVSAKNETAKRIYIRNGFGIVSAWPKTRLLPKAVFRMTKEL